MSDDIAEVVNGIIHMGLSLGTFISREGLKSYLGIAGSLTNHDHSDPDSFKPLNLTPKIQDSFEELAGDDVSICPRFREIADAAALVEVDISGATRFCGIIDPVAANPLSNDKKLPFKACCFVAWAITQSLITLVRTNKTAEALRQENQFINEEIRRRWPENHSGESIPANVLELSGQDMLTYLAGRDIAAIENGVKKIWPNCELYGKELAKAVYFNLYLPFVNEVIGFDEPVCHRAPDFLDPRLRIYPERPNVWQIACFHEA